MTSNEQIRTRRTSRVCFGARLGLQTISLVLLLLFLLTPTLAANDPGHDTLYIEETGNSELTGSLNISQDLQVAERLFADYLDIRGNGSISGSTNRIAGTASNLYIESSGDIIFNDQLGTTNTVRIGYSGDAVDLAVTGIITQNGQNVCLANGTNCAGGNNTGNVTSISAGNGLSVDQSVGDVTISTSASTCAGDEYSYWDGDSWECRTDEDSGTLSEATVESYIYDNGNALGAQWTVTSDGSYDINFDSNTFVVDASEDRVGIGTTGPAEKLHIVGNTRIDSGMLFFNDSSEIRFYDDGHRIIMDRSSGDLMELREWGDIILSAGATGGVASNTIFMDDATQNVGINTGSPNTTLHVAGDLNVTSSSDICISGDKCLSQASTSGGDLTDVLQGPGITVTSSSGPQPNVSIDATYTQRRVSGSCGAGQAVASITEAGGVTCRMTGDASNGSGWYNDTATTYTAFNVNITSEDLYLPSGYVFASGNVPSNPAYSFYDDRNTGMYNPAADNIAFSVNAGEILRVNSSGAFVSSSQVCTAANGLCGGSSSGGGWTNTSTVTSTDLHVNITTGNLTVPNGKVIIGDTAAITNGVQPFLYIKEGAGSGQATPQSSVSQIVIDSDGFAGINMLAAGSGSMSLNFGHSVDANAGVIEYHNSYDSFSFRTNAGAQDDLTIDNSGNVGIGIAVNGANAQLHVDTDTASDIGLIVQGFASQTANLTEWQDNNSATLAYVDATGDIYAQDGQVCTASNGLCGGGSVGGTGTEHILTKWDANGNLTDSRITDNTANQYVAISTNISMPSAFWIGSGGSVSGTNSIAIGSSAEATQQSAVAVGYQTTSSNTQTVAIGHYANASQSTAIAIGSQSEAGGAGSVAIGPSSQTDNTGSVAIGGTALGADSISIGGDATVGGAVVIGDATASANNAISIGTSSDSSGSGSIAIGNIAFADSTSSIALGGRANSSHTRSVALGYNSTTTADYQLMIGSVATAQRLDTYIHGDLNVSTGKDICISGGKCLSQADTSGGDGTGGWTNTSTKTSTSLEVDISNNLWLAEAYNITREFQGFNLTVISTEENFGSLVFGANSGAIMFPSAFVYHGTASSQDTTFYQYHDDAGDYSPFIFAEGSAGNLALGNEDFNWNITLKGSNSRPLYDSGSGATQLALLSDVTGAYGGWTASGGWTNTSLNVSVTSGSLYITGTAPELVFNETDNTEWRYVVDGDQWLVQRNGTDVYAVTADTLYFKQQTMTNNEDAVVAITASAADSELRLAANNTHSVYLKPDGAFGINEPTPVYALEIVNHTTNGAFGVSSTDGAEGDIFVIDEQGYVGINLNTPTAQLDITGNIAITGSEVISSSRVGSFASGTTVDSSSVCTPANGLCNQTVGSSSSAGGWTNTSTYTYTNLEVNISDNFWANSTHVGIGTSSPQARLQINQGTQGEGANETHLIIKNPDTVATAGGAIEFLHAAGTAGAKISSQRARDGSGTEQDLLFSVSSDGASYTDAMFIKQDGNVGIGTTNPSATLDVVGTLETSGAATIGAASTVAGSSICTPANGLCNQSVATAGGWTDTGTEVQLETSSDNVSAGTFFVDNTNSRIGIGTSTPESAIEINTNGTGGDFHFDNIDGDDEAFFRMANGVNLGLLMRSDTNDPKIGAWTDGTLQFYPYLATYDGDLDTTKGPLMYLEFTNEMVGINVSNPATTLDVGGNINATGDICTSGGYCLSDITGASGTVGGTGTEYYVTRWSSGGADIENSLLWSNTTHVGIGTTSPQSRLQIGDNTNNVGNRIILGEYDAASQGYLPIIQQKSVLNAGVGNDLAMGATSGDGGILFYTGATAATQALGTGSNDIRMAINKDGDIGIGTINPNTTLHVVGSINATNNVCDEASGNCLANMATDEVGTLTTNRACYSDGSSVICNDDDFFWNPSTNRLGVGTADPQGLLHVEGTEYIGWQDGSANGDLRFYQGANGNAGEYARIYADYDNLYLSNTNGGYMFFSNDSNHAIKLQESGSPYAWVDMWYDGESTGGTGFWLDSFSDAVGSQNFKLGEAGGSTAFNVRDSSNAILMSVNSSGSVSIGTTSTTYGLNVGSNVGASAFYSWEGNATWPRYTFMADSNTGMFLSGTDALGFTAGGTEALTINGSFVGINVSNPATTLDVGGNINATGDICTSGGYCLSDITGASGTVGGTGTEYYVTRWSSGGADIENSLLWSNTTHVGIGTATPSNLLTLGSGSIMHTQTTDHWLELYNNDADTGWYWDDGDDALEFYRNGDKDIFFDQYNFDVFRSDLFRVSEAYDGVGIGVAVPQAQLHINGSDAQGALLITDASDNNIFFVNASNGLVGINTTSPNRLLHIQKNNAGTDSAGVSALKLHNSYSTSGASEFGVGIEFQLASDYQDYKKAEIRAVNSGGFANDIDLTFWTGGSTTADHQERMRIQSDGLIGINTTAPTAWLDIDTVGSASTPNLQMGVDGKLSFYDTGSAQVINGQDLLYLYSAGEIRLTPNNDEDDYISIITTSNIPSIRTDASSDLVLLPGQQLGVGTSVPNATLHVAGTINATGDICTDAGGGVCLSTAGGSAGMTVWRVDSDDDSASNVNNNTLMQLLGGTGIITSHSGTDITITSTVTDTNLTGETAAGDLSGTYPNPSVRDDSHEHDAANITSGTLAIARGGTGASSTSQNYAFIGPTSGAGTPSFRALVDGDIPDTITASNYVRTGTWEDHADYPSDCAAGTVVQGLGDTLTCVAAGNITGTGGANTRVAYWDGTGSITGDAGFTFDGVTLTIPGNITTGANSFYIGNSATSNGTDSIAIGENSYSDGAQSVALGVYATANEQQAIAIGSISNAANSNSIAIGLNTEAVANEAIAIGSGANATGAQAISIGLSSDATGADAIAMGEDSNAGGGSNIAIGRATDTANWAAIAIGDDADVWNNWGIGLGVSSDVTGNYGIALGYTASVSATGGMALGNASVADQTNSIALGQSANTNETNQLMIGSATYPLNIATQGNITIYDEANCITMPGGGTLCGNSTCIYLTSPDGGTTVESCN